MQDDIKLRKAKEEFEHRCQTLREKLADPNFLNNQGLGNEVGFFTFCYHPALELRARAFFAQLQRESEAGKLPCRILRRNLYDVLLQICEDKRILDAIPRQEAKRGSERQVRQLAKVASPQVFAAYIDYEPHEPGDVLLIDGAGEVYPFLRTHNLLDNMQHLFEDVPVIVAYPGVFDGKQFSLFGKLSDGNYYRAFDLT